MSTLSYINTAISQIHKCYIINTGIDSHVFISNDSLSHISDSRLKCPDTSLSINIIVICLRLWHFHVT